MKPVTVTTTVQRPIEEVFDHLDVLANHEAFTDHFLTDWRVSGPERGVGAEVRVKLKPGGQQLHITALESVRPERTVERTVSGGGKRSSLGTYRLTPAGEGATHVEFELLPERMPVYERPLAPLLAGYMRKQNARAMERLKAQLEQAPAPA
jgi:Polyketide cyclase / dehydrase and lipid transport